MGLALPAAPAPVASYVQTRLIAVADRRSLLFVSGQVSRDGEKLLTGRCPDEVSVEEAAHRARIAALNVLAQIDAAVGLDAVIEMSQVFGYVLSADGFGEQPKVVNGASELFTDVLGAAGRHTRAALGVNALPFSVTVEIAAVALVQST